MASWEGKKYKMISTENFDEYLSDVGFSALQRTLLRESYAPNVYLVRNNGDTYSLHIDTRTNQTEIKFRPDEEFDHKFFGGQKTKALFTFEGKNKLIQVVKNADISTRIIFEFTDIDLIANEPLSRQTSDEQREQNQNIESDFSSTTGSLSGKGSLSRSESASRSGSSTETESNDQLESDSQQESGSGTTDL